jgi:hypothetical protein
MKNTQLTSILSSKVIACVLTIGSLAVTQPVSAQSGVALIQVTIPFPFQTALQTWLAGKYRIVEESSDLSSCAGPAMLQGL